MDNYSLVKIADAEDEPITLFEAQTHLRLPVQSPSNAEEDEYVTALITAARVAIENEINRPIGTQTYELGLRYWPTMLRFPRPPLINVLSIKYELFGGEKKTLYDTIASPAINSSVFKVDASGDPGELWLRGTESWPADELEPGYPIRIRFTCGIAVLEQPLKQAMLMVLSHLYENREPVGSGTQAQPFELPMSVKWLCKPYAFEEFR
ncbi:MAG TPA: head-tail connector protein [Clostridia bacterium]|nr:head-tail connector protein [Clostridia bacterium]